MRDTAVDTLAQSGHQVVVTDLYAENFNPVAGQGDFGNRRDPDYLVYSLEQRNGWQERIIAPDIVREAERILACDSSFSTLLFSGFPRRRS